MRLHAGTPRLLKGAPRVTTGSKLTALVLLTLLAACSLANVEVHRLALLGFSTAVLALAIFGLSRSGETAEILSQGILASFRAIEDEVDIDLDRFGRHTRLVVGILSGITLAYWFGIRTYVSLALGLVGATLVFAEFVINVEVLGHLTSSPEAAFSPAGAARIVSVHRVLSVVHVGAVLTAIAFLLVR